MSFSDSVLVALFTMSVVFAVLAMLWAIIRVFSLIIQTLESRKAKISSGNRNE